MLAKLILWPSGAMARNCELGTTDLGSYFLYVEFLFATSMENRVYPHQIGSYCLQIVKTKENPIFDTLKNKVAQLQCVGLIICGPFASLQNLGMGPVPSSFLTLQHFHIKSRLLFSKNKFKIPSLKTVTKTKNPHKLGIYSKK